MTQYDPAIHHRRSIRLRGYDYAQSGAYFVTISTYHYAHIFGEIVDDTIHLNAYGQIVGEDWQWLVGQYAFVELDTFVVMPHHLHGIIVIEGGEGGSRTARTKPLGGLIGAFKTVSTKHVNEWRETTSAMLWHRNYYEHIIRNDDDLDRIREYIATNPARWSEDAGNSIVRAVREPPSDHVI
jgi:putative transposase